MEPHLAATNRWCGETGVKSCRYLMGCWEVNGIGWTTCRNGITALHRRLRPDDFGYFVFYPYPGTPLFKTCLDLGVLPEGFEGMPANHRESILNLPDLTQADIDEYYDRFTAIREASYLARYGNILPDDGEKTVRDRYQKTAATG